MWCPIHFLTCAQIVDRTHGVSELTVQIAVDDSM